jgi:hypothetical protein
VTGVFSNWALSDEHLWGWRYVRDLRDLCDARRMSDRLAGRIEHLLTANGLCWLPERIPTNQDALVVLYAPDSPLAPHARKAS